MPRRRRQAQTYLLIENFAGTVIDRGRWTPTDTESKISVSGGLLQFSGPHSTPNYGDPGINRMITRQSGLCIITKLQASTAPGAVSTFLVLSPTNVAATLNAGGAAFEHMISLGSSNVLKYRNPSANLVTPFQWSNNAWVWILCIAGSSGAWVYASNDGISFPIVYYDASGNTNPLYAWIGLRDTASGKADFCRVYRSSVPTPIINIAQSITPATGDELLTNGNMETGNPPSSWTAVNATLTGAADERTGGAGAQSISVANSGAAAGYGMQAFDSIIGGWYLTTGWIRKVTSNVRLRVIGNADPWPTLGVSEIISSTSWAQVAVCARATQTTIEADLLLISATSGEAGRFDDISTKNLTLSSLVGTLQTARKEACFDVKVSGLPVGMQAGAWINTDGLTDGNQNAVEILMDRASNTIRMSKYVAGTLTNNIISSAFTYADNAVLRLIPVGNSYGLYYAQDGVTFSIVGTVQTISDATIRSQTGFRGFSTSDAATLTLTCYPGINVG